MSYTKEQILQWLKNETYMEIDECSADEPNEIHLRTRDDGDVGEEEPGEGDLQHARELCRKLRKQFPGIKATGEVIDEWVDLVLEF